jgi:hypothetical protein
MKPILSLTFAASLALVALPAHADCANPIGGDYTVTTTGSTVTICPTGAGGGGPLLRQDVSTGEVVEIGGCSQPNPMGGVACFVDECVPSGEYRYGFAEPFTCSDVSGGCGRTAYYFEEATVGAEATGSCKPSIAGCTATATDTVPPWMSGADLTQSTTCPSSGCSISAAGDSRVLFLDGVVMVCGLAFAVRSARRRAR